MIPPLQARSPLTQNTSAAPPRPSASPSPAGDRIELGAHAADPAHKPTPPAPKPTPPVPPAIPAVDSERVKTLFLELTQIRGGTGNERKVADTITQKLGAMGYTPREDGAAKATRGNTGNLLLDIPGTIADAPGVILMAHMDTVSVAVGSKPQIRDGVIYSDGTTGLGADNRTGCAEILEAIRLLQESKTPHGPIQVIFTVGEEGGLLGSSALRREDVHGNIGYAVDSFHPNEIFMGWDGPIMVDDRENVQRNHEKAQDSFRRAPKPDEVLQPQNNAEGFLLDFTRAGIRDIGLTPSERRLWGASSDAAALREMGIPAMTIGAGEQDIHSRQEHVSIEDLKKSTELVLRLVANATRYQVDGAGRITPRA